MRFNLHRLAAFMLASGAMLASVSASAQLVNQPPVAPFKVVLTAPQEMVVNQPYVSANGVYTLIFQSDGNMVIYKGPPPYTWRTAIWSTGSDVKQGRKAVMQTDGNLVVYDANNAAVWDSRTGQAQQNYAPFLTLNNDGSIQITSSNPKSNWSSPRDPAAPSTNPGGCTTARQYGICVFPNSPSRFTSFVLACSMAEAQRMAAASGAVFGACR
ncbi:hypothetical protein [Massilia sp. YMA4]|uniref:hypothetical protein n=1 Tax=Massilia sp. YMA4 TaxID=1593482 RepID=UPI000DD10193|nr:hypothetical protein [Massilia sp. YMA4]AXA91445.1 hypothetical protein DPH57_09935 [Massilia sp. YMA4]